VYISRFKYRSKVQSNDDDDDDDEDIEQGFPTFKKSSNPFDKIIISSIAQANYCRFVFRN